MYLKVIAAKLQFYGDFLWQLCAIKSWLLLASKNTKSRNDAQCKRCAKLQLRCLKLLLLTEKVLIIFYQLRFVTVLSKVELAQVSGGRCSNINIPCQQLVNIVNWHEILFQRTIHLSLYISSLMKSYECISSKCVLFSSSFSYHYLRLISCEAKP